MLARGPGAAALPDQRKVLLSRVERGDQWRKDRDDEDAADDDEPDDGTGVPPQAEPRVPPKPAAPRLLERNLSGFELRDAHLLSLILGLSTP
jgi:hypothetical protein